MSSKIRQFILYLTAGVILCGLCFAQDYTVNIGSSQEDDAEGEYAVNIGADQTDDPAITPAQVIVLIVVE